MHLLNCWTQQLQTLQMLWLDKKRLFAMVYHWLKSADVCTQKRGWSITGLGMEAHPTPLQRERLPTLVLFKNFPSVECAADQWCDCPEPGRIQDGRTVSTCLPGLNNSSFWTVKCINMFGVMPFYQPCLFHYTTFETYFVVRHVNYKKKKTICQFEGMKLDHRNYLDLNEKTCLQGFRPCKAQTNLLSYRD